LYIYILQRLIKREKKHEAEAQMTMLTSAQPKALFPVAKE